MRMRFYKARRQQKMSASCSLFEECCSQVLCSPCLLDRASLHLPRGVSYFLLYLAVETGNQLAVKKLVEKWPHGDLTLDFVSESWLCRRRFCRSPRCLEPHEYMGVFGSYARYSSLEIVSSLLEGVFYNLYHYHGVEGAERVGLRRLDMSAVVIDEEKFPLLLNLVRGNVPATHDLSSTHLQNRPTSPDQLPLCLLVNVVLRESRCVGTMGEICSHCQWVEVRLKGVNVLGLNWAGVSEEDWKSLMRHVTGSFHIRDLSGRFNTASDGSLTLIMASGDVNKLPLDCRDLLLLSPISKSSELLAAELSLLASQRQSLRSFCLHSEHCSTTVVDSLCVLLESVSSSLQFLQIQPLNFTSIHLHCLQECSKLQVLSVTGSDDPGSVKHSVQDILTAVSQLPLLEFFRWSEGLNLTTNSLFSLHCLLKTHFSKLCHFHVSFSSVLLSTTDLENDNYSVLRNVLCPLVGLKEGTEAVTTYIFPFDGVRDVLLDWLLSVRPQVCFKLRKYVSEPNELRRALCV